MPVVTLGIDLAKNVFQLHGVDAAGNKVLVKRLSRSQVLPTLSKLNSCLVGMEACGSSHYWAREIQALGHEVRLMPGQYVKPYVKRNKTDAADAEAICEAVTRPTMRFVPIKDAEQQAVLMHHRSRELLVKQRTMLANAIRGHLGEFGLVVAQGLRNVSKLKLLLDSADPKTLPTYGKQVLELLFEQIEAVNANILVLEKRIKQWHQESELSRRLTSIPGVGPLTASAVVAHIGKAECFNSARSFAAWLGLTPMEHSSGGKSYKGGISKRGDGYIRRLLVHGARAVVRMRSRQDASPMPWLDGLLARKNRNTATVALANKNARMIWALLAHGTSFRGYAGNVI